MRSLPRCSRPAPRLLHLPAVAGCLLAAMLSAGASTAFAQATPSSCSYDACALRLTPGGFFSGAKLVRGASSEEVTRYGRSRTLEGLFATHDSSAFHYATFARRDRTASLLRWIGVGLITAGLAADLNSNERHTAWGVGLQLGGMAAGVVASIPWKRGKDSLTRAIWWYNRSLSGS